MSPDHVLTGLQLDLTDPELYASGDPFQVWRWLRANAPVYWHPQRDGPGFWALTRYADATQVYRDAATFSSARGIFIPSFTRGEPAGGKMLALTDPPRHGKVRALLNRRLSPRLVADIEPALVATANKLIEAVIDGDICDFVSDVAAELPLEAICELMGVPPGDRPSMLALTKQAFGADDPKDRSIAHQEILLYFAGLIADRRRSPRGDLVSILADGAVAGAKLTDEEILLNCDNLIVGGTENVRHAAAGGMLALIENEDQWQRLRANPGVIDTAVEEILRWTSPALHILRVATTDVEIGGQHVNQGDAVVIWNPSANRDEAVFPRPDRFDVTRAPNHHLSLGAGEHFCIGASLARRELRALFGCLARCVASVEPGGRVERLRSITIFGIERLPVRMRAASS